ncbi:hypothetical protein D3C83_70560 [compost metagenome]
MVPTASQTPSAAGSITFSIRSLTLIDVSKGGRAGAGGCEEHDITNNRQSGASHDGIRMCAPS